MTMRVNLTVPTDYTTTHSSIGRRSLTSFGLWSVVRSNAWPAWQSIACESPTFANNDGPTTVRSGSFSNTTVITIIVVTTILIIIIIMNNNHLRVPYTTLKAPMTWYFPTSPSQTFFQRPLGKAAIIIDNIWGIHRNDPHSLTADADAAFWASCLNNWHTNSVVDNID